MSMSKMVVPDAVFGWEDKPSYWGDRHLNGPDAGAFAGNMGRWGQEKRKGNPPATRALSDSGGEFPFPEEDSGNYFTFFAVTPGQSSVRKGLAGRPSWL